MKRRVVGLVIGSVLLVEGCQHTCQRACSPPVVPGAACNSCNAAPVGGPILPVPAGRLPMPQSPGDTRGYVPPPVTPQPTWQAPADSRARLTVPQDLTPEPPRQGVRLQPPELTPQTPSRPPVVEERPLSPTLPVGIPQFANVKDQVASGLKPLLDGWDWLKDNGFRTVLHLRQPGEDDNADRLLAEKRGLKFLSLEASPKTLSKNVVDEFNRLVGDKANYPLFVYDKDGVVAGGLWYLYFRTVDRLTDEEARKKASSLGLKEEPDGEQRLMWLAIQKYLSEQSR